MNKIGLVLGYSEVFEEDSPHGEWLRRVFGRFKNLQFHLEETSDTTIRVTVQSEAATGIAAIHERFGGHHRSRHRAKSGQIIDFFYYDRLLLISPYEISLVTDERIAAVA